MPDDPAAGIPAATADLLVRLQRLQESRRLTVSESIEMEDVQRELDRRPLYDRVMAENALRARGFGVPGPDGTA